MMLKPSWTTLRLAALLTLLANALLPSTAQPSKVTVGVSWGHLEGEWKIHEDALRARLGSLGAQYTRTDAKGSSAQQLRDMDALAAKGADVLIVVAANPEALRPGLARAQAAGIPVVAYDRPVPDPAAFYVGFDELEAGRMQARAVYAVRPHGRYALLLGPGAERVRQGLLERLEAALKAGDVRVVAERSVAERRPEAARQAMAEILAAQPVDAVLTSDDRLAAGAAAALAAAGLAGKVPVGGVGGDAAALNRVALGTQAVSVWKDPRALGRAAAEVAVRLARGAAPAALAFEGAKAGPLTLGPVMLEALLVRPVPVTPANLDAVLRAGWVSKAALCQGVRAAPPACR